MKYIRTWYGKLFGVAGLSKTGKSVFYISKKSGKQCQMPRNSRDRIADTIEELCDEFVVCQEGKQPISTSIDEKEMFMKMKAVIMLSAIAKMDCWMKLAIWTDKGLIYVAEMNDKGEFKLL